MLTFGGFMRAIKSLLLVNSTDALTINSTDKLDLT